MRRIQWLWTLLLLGMVALPFGCVHTTAGQASLTPVCLPPPGLAAVCIYRNQLMGARIDVDIFVDNQPLGQSTNDHFVQIDVPAGAHMLMATSRIGSPSMLQVNAAEGASTFVKITMDPVAYGVVLPTLRPYDAAAAMREIRSDCEAGFHTALAPQAPPPPPTPGT